MAYQPFAPGSAVGLLSPRHAAEWLDVSRSRVYTLMADGTLPYVRIGSQRRIRVAELEAYVDRLSAALNQP
jgi:excisionase family DNA binding protein